MVELVVTIGIIVLLVSMVVYAAGAIVRRSEVTRTRNTLDLIEQVRQAWELESGRAITFGDSDPGPPPYTFDIDESVLTPDLPPPAQSDMLVNDLTRKMLSIFERMPQVKDVIARIESDRIKRDMTDPPSPLPLGWTGWLQIRDSWDTPIIAIHPGDDWVDGPYPQDEDASFRIPIEEKYGIALHRIVLFVAAGPDGKFGNLHLDVAQASLTTAQKADIALAGDNLYSYEPKKDRP